MNTGELTEAVRAVPYPSYADYPIEDKTFVKAKHDYTDKVSELEHEWKLWLAEQYASSFPTRTQDLIFSKAWEQGHSSGYYEIEGCYIDYAEFADKVIELQ